MSAQFAGVRRIYANPRFWWIAPLAGFGMGSFMAVQGLWAVPWMLEVQGVSREVAADRLFAMSVVILCGYLGLGMFSTALRARGVEARHLFGAGFTASALAFALILADAPGSALWWSLYGLGAAANILAFGVLNEGFPRELAARSNTAVNLMMFVGSFLTQWGIGGVVDALRALRGVPEAAGLRYAFCIVLVLDVATLAWFFRGWSRHSHPRP